MTKTKLYCITCRTNGKMYVGITSRLLYKRWRQHVYDANTRNSCCNFHRAIRKYGEDNFEVELLAEAPSREDAAKHEVALIHALNLNSATGGYNSSKGGDGGATRLGLKHTAETRARMSESARARGLKPNITPEGRRAVADALRGRERPIEVKKKISAAITAAWARRREAALADALFAYAT